MKDCFIGLGGNVGNTLEVIKQTIRAIAELGQVFSPETSRVFLTAAVSDLPQDSYLNAAMRLKTTYAPHHLFSLLEQIEVKMGKKKKAKNAPRVIDIDLLFYGNLSLNDDILTLPHPRWQERLFVLHPLKDLTKTAPGSQTVRLERMISSLESPHEKVIVLSEILPYQKKEFL